MPPRFVLMTGTGTKQTLILGKSNVLDWVDCGRRRKLMLADNKIPIADINPIFLIAVLQFA